MFARTLIVAGGLVLVLAGAAAAQTVVTGSVNRIDQPASVIVLQDGRMVAFSPAPWSPSTTVSS